MRLTLPLFAAFGLSLTACGPDKSHVERSRTYKATVADVYPHVADMRKFVVWSPWSGRDPSMTQEFSDPSSGLNAWYSWKGNDDVGSGKMTITKADEGKTVVQKLEFFEPWEGVAEATFVVTAEGDDTKVTWSFDQDLDTMGKVMGMFMDMDAMIGGDYEAGLANLDKEVAKTVEARVKKEAEEAAAKKAAEEAAMAAAEGADADGDAAAPE